MAGISSYSNIVRGFDSNCGCSLRKGFNGNEIQSKEFSDKSGLEFYDFNARTYDGQVGRFIQEDPTPSDAGQEVLTQYHFGGNNPISFNDPDGKCPFCIGFIVGALVDYGTQVAGNLIGGKSLSASLTEVDVNQIVISGVSSGLTGGGSLLTTTTVTGKVAKEIATTTVEIGESVAKQINEGSKTGKSFSESISLKQTASDVISNKIGGKLMDNVNSTNIGFATKQLNKAEQIASKDVASTGRANAAKLAKTRLAEANSVKQLASGVSGNILQSASNQLILLDKTYSTDFSKVSREKSIVDNTFVKKPILGIN